MRSLTARQKLEVASAQDEWLSWIFSTKAAERKLAEDGVRETYRAGGVAQPEAMFWFDDPMEGYLVLEQLSDHRESNWMLPAEAMPARERARRGMRKRLGLRTWDQVIRAIGPQHTEFRYESYRNLGLGMAVAVPREDSLQAGLRTLRIR